MKKLVIRVDIDETICETPDNPRDYSKAIPRIKTINKINQLYDYGHTIIYWTSRGSRSGIDWSEMTKQQLDSWGARYNCIECNKPYYDCFIDDRSGFMDLLEKLLSESKE